MKKALDPFLRPLERVLKNPRRALATPRTTLDRLKRDYDASFTEQLSREPAEIFISRILDLIPESAAAEFPKLIQQKFDEDRAALREDVVGAQLLALYDAADAAGPISPMMAIIENPDDGCVDGWTVLAKFDEAAHTKGEKRARALLEAIPDLIEKMYGRYLKSLWTMSSLAEGKWPSRPPESLGNLVNQVAPRVQIYTGLVDADAGHLRNAVAHRHAEYMPSKRSIEFREQSGWQLTLTTKALEAKLVAIWHVASVLTTKLRALATTDVYLRSGMFEVLPLLRGAFQGDASAIKALADKNMDDAIGGQLFRKKPPSGTDLRFLSRK